jgi:formate-dependent nitrite reductase membrane component NrfD
VTAVLEGLGISPRLKLVTQTIAGVLGLPMTTYTAALLADTAVPAWHEVRGELPFVFGASAAMSAGAASMILTPAATSAPARRLAIAAAAVEVASSQTMTSRLGDLVGEPYRVGRAAKLSGLSRSCVVVGGALGLISRRRRTISAVSGALMLAGALLQRFAIVEAGRQSARDPKYTVVPQRARGSTQELQLQG